MNFLRFIEFLQVISNRWKYPISVSATGEFLALRPPVFINIVFNLQFVRPNSSNLVQLCHILFLLLLISYLPESRTFLIALFDCLFRNLSAIFPTELSGLSKAYQYCFWPCPQKRKKAPPPLFPLSTCFFYSITNLLPDIGNGVPRFL